MTDVYTIETLKIASPDTMMKVKTLDIKPKIALYLFSP